MLIWLVKLGEPLQTRDKKSIRLMRTGMLADYLQSDGHKVVWWQSGFEHHSKTLYFKKDTVEQITESSVVNYIYARPYKKNISLSRLYHYFVFALKFQKAIKNCEKPDIILCSFPSIQLSKICTDYGLKNKVPVVIDVRDLWPDMIVERVNIPLLNPLMSLVFAKLRRDLRRVFSNATNIIAISAKYLEWALNQGQRDKRDSDKVFRLAYRPVTEAGNNNILRINELIKNMNDKFCVIFLGTVTQYQLDGFYQINAAARRLEKSHSNILFVIAGTGDMYDKVKNEVSNLSNIEYPGWCTIEEVRSILKNADLSINPYYSQSFQKAMGNKVSEYLSAGLPLITCLKGDLSDILSSHQCGTYYSVGDVDGLIDVIVKYYDDEQLYKKTSENALQAFELLFNSEKVIPSIAEHLEDTVSRYNIK